MAVLVEAISVIVRMDSLDSFGTWEAFKAIVPNETLCADTELARVGFMSPAETREFVDLLRSHGLRFSDTGPAEDIAICDQQRGFTTQCGWAEFGSIDLDHDPARTTACARLKGSKVQQLATPIGWTWEDSLTREFSFVPTEPELPRIRPIRIRGRSSGKPEDGPHGWGVHVQEIEPEKPKPRPSLWDRLHGRH